MDTFDAKELSSPSAAETGTLFIFLVCISILSLLLGRKTAATSLRAINYARALVISLYVVSWFFSFAAAVLSQINNHSMLFCNMSSYTCIFVYASTKIIIYLFLIERVHIVTSFGTTRWNSRMFKFNMVLLMPYSGIATLAVMFRISRLDGGVCIMALGKPAYLPLIAYDAFISSWLTALFVRSLISSTSMLRGPTRNKLREVARRALVGSIVALILSTANISTYLVFPDEEGLLCFTLCTLDVTLNTIAIHWVTSSGNSNSTPAKVDRVALIEAAGGSGGSGGGGVSGGSSRQQGIDKHVTPLKTHISVSIDSYVEEYHQMHLSERDPNDSRPQ